MFREGGSNIRLANLLGIQTKERQIKTKESIPSTDRSMFSQEKYKFFLEAPFEISNKCCTVMKKDPAHKYNKSTGRNPILAVMASESRIRTQMWIRNGCNGFKLKIPTSNPMSFWTEQDVLTYIKLNNLAICSVYGEVVYDSDVANQMSIFDFEDVASKELFELDRPVLKTTGCSRTGCVLCGFGCHLNDQRFVMLKQTHPKLYSMLDMIQNNGITYRQAIDWVNEHGNLNIKY